MNTFYMKNLALVCLTLLLQTSMVTTPCGATAATQSLPSSQIDIPKDATAPISIWQKVKSIFKKQGPSVNPQQMNDPSMRMDMIPEPLLDRTQANIPDPSPPPPANTQIIPEVVPDTPTLENPDSSQQASQQNAHEKTNDAVVDESKFLAPKLDDVELRRLAQSREYSNAKMKRTPAMTIWVSGIEGVLDPKQTIESLPERIGVFLNAYSLLPDDLIQKLKKRHHPLGLLIPTRTRTPGRQNVNGTLNSHLQSAASLTKIINTLKVKTIYLPQSIDLDQTVWPNLKSIIEENKLNVILPPQINNHLTKLIKPLTKRGDVEMIQCTILPDTDDFDTNQKIKICKTRLDQTPALIMGIHITQENLSQIQGLISWVQKNKIDLLRADDFELFNTRLGAAKPKKTHKKEKKKRTRQKEN